MRSWVWGGALLIASAVGPYSLYAATDQLVRSVVSWLGVLAFAAAVLLFALGWPLRFSGGRGAVAAGEWGGTVALVVLALWPVVSHAVSAVARATSAPIMSADDPALGFWRLWGAVDLVVWFAAALVAVVAIARARIVPAPWQRAPLWALIVVAGLWIVQEVLGVALGQAALDAVLTLASLVGLVTLLAPLGLGILAIVLGLRPEPRRSVEVFSSAPAPAPPER